MITKKASEEWLKKTCKFASFPEKEDEPIRQHVQWMTSDKKHFFPASEVVKQLPPGYYKVLSNMGEIFFQKQDLWKEKLIKFPETASDTVVAEIEKFWDKEQEYRDAKLAYRRGLLLYGPPGSGKSSAIKLAMRNIIARKGIVLEFGHPSYFVGGMKIIREIQPEMPVIALMEDIDAILDRSNESEILNIIDGVTPMDKCLFLATTNYMERLSSRITNRPSRFDKRFEIGMPNSESREIYLKEIAGNKISANELSTWVKDTAGLSIAHLKELVVSVTILGYKYADAINALKGLKQKIYSDEYRENHSMPIVVVTDSSDEKSMPLVATR